MSEANVYRERPYPYRHIEERESIVCMSLLIFLLVLYIPFSMYIPFYMYWSSCCSSCSMYSSLSVYSIHVRILVHVVLENWCVYNSTLFGYGAIWRRTRAPHSLRNFGMNENLIFTKNYDIIYIERWR